MTFGIKKKLSTKTFITIHAEGDNAGSYDFVNDFKENYPELNITHAEVKVYYNNDGTGNSIKPRSSEDNEQSKD